MGLRVYQEEAVKSIEQEWNNGNKKTLLVLPTGTGKTVVFSKVVEDSVNQGEKALILAHTEELIKQASDKLKAITGLDSAIEKAEKTAVGSNLDVTVASIQTLSIDNRLTKFSPDYFQTIVVDEAHHSMSDTYQKVLNYFSNSKVLGVTATPDRADHKNLGKFYNSKAYEYTIRQAIKEGYLSSVKAQMIPLKIDINDVSVSNGDYALGEVGNALEPYLNQIAMEMVKYCKTRKTVVFLPLIKISQKFCELLNQYGLRAVEVNGNSIDRDEILTDFENGKYDVICNSMLLTEGWDCPSVDCVVVLRPTKIRSLYQQMVGRGLRLAPNKKDLLILDFLWMTGKHDLARPSALLAKNDEEATRINKIVSESDDLVDLIDIEAKVEKDIVKEKEEALAKELAAERHRKSKLVNPIQYIYSIEDEDLSDYEPIFDYEKAPATESQIAYLEKQGINPEMVSCFGMARLLIDKLKMRREEGLATPKQIRLLEKYGFKYVGTWYSAQANELIGRIQDNKWRVPRDINIYTYVPKEVDNTNYGWGVYYD